MALKEVSRNSLAAARLRRIAADLILEAEALEAEEAANMPPKPNAQALIAAFGRGDKPKRKKP